MQLSPEQQYTVCRVCDCKDCAIIEDQTAYSDYLNCVLEFFEKTREWYHDFDDYTNCDINEFDTYDAQSLLDAYDKFVEENRNPPYKIIKMSLKNEFRSTGC